MIKKLGLTAVALSALLLSGCGGGGDDSDPMDDKNYIVILQSVQSGICESDALASELISSGFIGLLTRETDTSTTCGTYGKANDYVECGVEFIGDGDRNCVVGFDDIEGDFDVYAKQTSPVTLNDKIELITPNFK